jgi:hypothetical protein
MDIGANLADTTVLKHKQDVISPLGRSMTSCFTGYATLPLLNIQIETKRKQ